MPTDIQGNSLIQLPRTYTCLYAPIKTPDSSATAHNTSHRMVLRQLSHLPPNSQQMQTTTRPLNAVPNPPGLRQQDERAQPRFPGSRAVGAEGSHRAPAGNRPERAREPPPQPFQSGSAGLHLAEQSRPLPRVPGKSPSSRSPLRLGLCGAGGHRARSRAPGLT